MLNRLVPLMALAPLVFMIVGCSSPQGSTIQEKRDSVLQMQDDALNSFYTDYPSTQQHTKTAPGYAVFSNFGLKILIVGSGNGYGVVHDNTTGKDTYMRMVQGSFGVGFGAQDFRALFIFNNPNVMRQFVNEGWEFGGNADAGAKYKSEGAEAGMAVSINDIDIYRITRTGGMLAATVGGTKYWKDSDLNSSP